MMSDEDLTSYLYGLGLGLINRGFSVKEVNAVVSYVRKAFYRGESIENALEYVCMALIEGKMLPE